MSGFTEGKKLLLVGLPASGKTSFLGALAYLVSSHNEDIALREAGLPTDRTYINELAQRWLSCQPMERTTEAHPVEFHLGCTSGEFQLLVPDLSGETWKDTLWCNRQCPQDLKDHAEKCDGVIFFIHSTKGERPIQITTIQEMDGGSTQQSKSDEVQEWDPYEHVPVQSVAVDILQLLASPQLAKHPRRLAVVISAWDLAANANYTPLQYLAEEFPLLSQYLNSMFDYPDYQVFGVSALGGDPNKEAKKLAAKDKPFERIMVVDESYQGHDVSRPVQWAIGLQ